MNIREKIRSWIRETERKTVIKLGDRKIEFVEEDSTKPLILSREEVFEVDPHERKDGKS